VIRKKRAPKERVIDLTGPDGNAYALMGMAKDLLRQIGCGHQETALMEDMMSGDYEHLVEVFDKKFGDYVVLER
tara:strand:- start:33 stop:254 length:222 start_codon:yes stop_codon:yes gene_type:complete